MTVNEAREYLRFTANVLGELMINRQCFLDFYDALKKQRAENNIFIAWCFENYRKVMILNLCKLLEPKDVPNPLCDTRKRTIHSFITYWNKPQNYALLKKYANEATVTFTRGRTGKAIERSIAEVMTKKLQAVRMKEDLDVLSDMFARMKDYRDAKLCHNDQRDIDEVMLPQIKEMHEFIDTLEAMFDKYFGLFRVCFISGDSKKPNSYNNFILRLA